MADLGTARGRIEIDASGATSGAAEAERAAGKATGSWTKASGGLTALGGGLTAAAGVVAVGFGFAVKSAADFETRISAIAAVSGATGAELEAIRQKALQLGKDTSFSASEAATAMEELVKAGLPLEGVLNGAADAAVALAAAGGVAIPEAATQISNAINAFGISADKVANVADVIAGAANASAIDVGEFGQSLKQVGAVAALAGVSFEDTATAIALLGQAGIKGSDAGTSLKTLFLNLIPTTQKQIDKFGELGLLTFNAGKAMDFLRTQGVQPLGKDQATLEKQLSGTVSEMYGLKEGSAAANKKLAELTNSTTISDNAFFDAQGNVKGLSDISGQLSNSLSSLTKEQKLATLETLFGTDAIRAAAILTEQGAVGFDKMAESIGKISAADVAATRLNNMQGRLEALKGSLETAAITIGTLLLPAVTSIIEFFTRLINKFLEMDVGTQKAILAFIAITAAILGVIGIVLTIVGVIGAFLAVLAPVAALIGITVGALVGWIAVIPIIIAAIVALGILIFKNFDAIKAKTFEVFGAIQQFFVDVFSAIGSFLSGVWASISSGISSAWDAIKSIFSTVLNAIKAVFTTIFDAVKTYITAVFAIYKAIFTAGINAIKAVWESVWGLFGPLIKAIFDVISAFFTLFWTIVKGIFLLAVNGIKILVETVFNAIKMVITTIMDGIKAVIQTVWNAISPIVTTAVNAIRTVVTTVFNAIRLVIETVMNAIRLVVSTVWGAITGVVGTAVEAVKAKVQLLSTLAGIVGGFFGRAVEAVREKIAEIISLAAGIAGRVTGAIGDLGRLLFNKGQQIVQGLIDGLVSKLTAIADAARAVTDTIARFLPGSPVREGPLKVLNRGYAGGQVMKMLADGMENQIPRLEATLGAVATLIPQALGQAAPSVTVPVSSIASQRSSQAAPSTMAASSVERDTTSEELLQELREFRLEVRKLPADWQQRQRSAMV